MTYQGWENYETWAAKLWMDNDPGEYEYWKEQAEQGIDTDEDKPTMLDNARNDLADSLKQYHEDNAPNLVGMCGDLLTNAIGNVNWWEIAHAMLTDAIEDAIHDAVSA